MQVHLKTIHESSAAAGWAGPRSLVIDRTPRAGGLGIGFSGEELFMMSIGASICNDLYREAASRGIELHRVEIIINGDWSGEPAQARNIRYDIRVQSNASRQETEDLIRHTDQIAEIPHTLRVGTAVKLNAVEVLHEAAK
ncbi:osmotically inducible protein C [Chitinophaga alhagiae]|uniref:Osmotically inducible protein C n=1 Tax=Chitinophaga alhagiae TaxID=2203219 RepID=A0ABM6W9J5_9BACT|nr:OsmC family protein [Chitinophaga alhagiae]AWO00596.1 osmotically inducible protein C [Chitinophaga alhagiae]